MNGPAPLIRNLTPAEVRSVAIAWADAEGWNPGQTDHDSFLAADPAGFWGLFLADEPVACISAVRYEPGFAFIGFYIVRPDYRGRGLGKMLWDHALLGLQGRTVGLDGVVEQQANYRKSGFQLAHRSIRFSGEVGVARDSVASGPEPRAVGLEDLAAIEAYDARHFPVRRGAFLRAWLTRPGTEAFAVWDGALVRGYGAIRPCRHGWKIGPLFAADAVVAGRLLSRLTARLDPGSTFYLDVCESNPAGVALAESRSLRRVFETARMYRGPAPDLPLPRIFGNTSFELG